MPKAMLEKSDGLKVFKYKIKPFFFIIFWANLIIYTVRFILTFHILEQTIHLFQHSSIEEYSNPRIFATSCRRTLKVDKCHYSIILQKQIA